MRYAIVGEHLPHSHSPKIHALFGNPDYGLCELAPDALAPFMRARNFDGVNVTIPYKQDVMPLCDFLDGAAMRIGAVNTVANYNGCLFGFNTDFDGFRFLCRRAGICERSSGRACMSGYMPTGVVLIRISASAHVLWRFL